MSNLLQEIEAQIAGVKTSVNKQNVGIVREIVPTAWPRSKA